MESAHDVIGSCDVNTPLRIDLLCLKDICHKLRLHAEAHKADDEPFLIPKIVYRSTKALRVNRNVLAANLINDLKNASSFLKPDAGLFSRLKFQVQNISEHKDLKKLVFQLQPQSLQIQSALYLGSRRISCFTYSELFDFADMT